MILFVESPSIVNWEVQITPEAKPAFIDWQSQFNAEIIKASGFVSLEFLSPSDEKGWMIVQRFSNPESLKAWRASKVYQELLAALEVIAMNHLIKEKESTDTDGKGNITEVIVTQVNPGMEASYRNWSAKIHHVEAKFPGFRGVYVQAPDDKGKNWITLLQFDNMANLDRWLQSPERKEILKESLPLVSSIESHRVISPFAGWFASIAKTGELPARWKQTMIVLLVLFPIVMFEFKYLNPHLKGMNISLATFIGNAISVALIAFPMTQIAIFFLKWWLIAKNTWVSILGACLVIFLYLLFIALFWNFLP